MICIIQSAIKTINIRSSLEIKRNNKGHVQYHFFPYFACNKKQKTILRSYLYCNGGEKTTMKVKSSHS
jgi:hypothetical protein